MKKHSLLALTIMILTFGFHLAKNVSAVELITNGGFESATAFQGWTAVNSASPWELWQNTTYGQGQTYTSVAATSAAPGGGTKNVWNGMTSFVNATSWSMYQTITVPAGNSITVSWHDRYQINHTEFCPGGACQPKFYFVELTNSAGTTVLQTLHTQSTIGNVNQNTGWVFHSQSIAGLGGQTIRIRFRGTETTALTGPGRIEIDNVSVNALPVLAAEVSLGGRITAANGNGIRNVVVSLTESNGQTRTTRTNAFGYYNFDEVEVGQNVTLTVNSKRYTFVNSTRIITVTENAGNVDWTAIE